jgi:hypothetical protein
MIKPKNKSTIVIQRLDTTMLFSMVPRPKNHSRNNSIGAHIGFAYIIQLNRTGMLDSGYTTGVPYIINCRATVINCRKSLYLVVIEEIIKPEPMAIADIQMNNTGKRTAIQLGEVSPRIK